MSDMRDKVDVGTHAGQESLPEGLREQAVTVLKKQRDFRVHVLVYVLVNSALVAVWVLTGANGLFWPMFPMVFWGIGVVMNGWDAYFVREPSEQQIAAEMERLRRR